MLSLSVWYKINKDFMRKERKNMDLTELRGQIDEIDSSIVDLYEKRMDISRQLQSTRLRMANRYLIRQEKKKRSER